MLGFLDLVSNMIVQRQIDSQHFIDLALLM